MSNFDELKNLKLPKFLDPFSKWLVTLGGLPSSYKLALTYEEQLLYFLRFLEEVVLPAINENAQALQELQEKFVSLVDTVESEIEKQNENIENKFKAQDKKINDKFTEQDDKIDGAISNMNSNLQAQNDSINKFKEDVNSKLSAQDDKIDRFLDNLNSQFTQALQSYQQQVTEFLSSLDIDDIVDNRIRELFDQGSFDKPIADRLDQIAPDYVVKGDFVVVHGTITNPQPQNNTLHSYQYDMNFPDGFNETNCVVVSSMISTNQKTGFSTGTTNDTGSLAQGGLPHRVTLLNQNRLRLEIRPIILSGQDEVSPGILIGDTLFDCEFKIVLMKTEGVSVNNVSL